MNHFYAVIAPDKKFSRKQWFMALFAINIRPNERNGTGEINLNRLPFANIVEYHVPGVTNIGGDANQSTNVVALAQLQLLVVRLKDRVEIVGSRVIIL
jgi:hypothetical protein